MKAHADIGLIKIENYGEKFVLVDQDDRRWYFTVLDDEIVIMGSGIEPLYARSGSGQNVMRISSGLPAPQAKPECTRSSPADMLTLGGGEREKVVPRMPPKQAIDQLVDMSGKYEMETCPRSHVVKDDSLEVHKSYEPCGQCGNTLWEETPFIDMYVCKVCGMTEDFTEPE